MAVIPRVSGNPQGGTTMHRLVILDLIQNPQGGDEWVTVILRTYHRHSPRKRESTGRDNDAPPRHSGLDPESRRWPTGGRHSPRKRESTGLDNDA